MTLDERLKNTADKLMLDQEGVPVDWQFCGKDFVADIKQALKDENYIQIPETVEYWNKIDGDNWVDVRYAHKVKRNGVELMSGQEWYNRFSAELKHLMSRGDGETWMGWDCGEVREAAKKASGITND